MACLAVINKNSFSQKMQCSAGPEAGMGWKPGSGYRQMSWNQILGNGCCPAVITKIITTKETDNFLNGFSPRKCLEDAKRPVLSSSEFCLSFQFQFQNDKAGKRVMETLAPLFHWALKQSYSFQGWMSSIQAHDESGGELPLSRVEKGPDGGG